MNLRNIQFIVYNVFFLTTVLVFVGSTNLYNSVSLFDKQGNPYPTIGRLFKADVLAFRRSRVHFKDQLNHNKQPNKQSITVPVITSNKIQNHRTTQLFFNNNGADTKYKIQNDKVSNDIQKSLQKTVPRFKRNTNEYIITNNKNTTSNNETEKHTNITTDLRKKLDHNITLKKDITQKLFKRKVEALFNIDSDKAAKMSEDEIEKSKLLRKQLLDYYIKAKQKAPLTPSIHQLVNGTKQKLKGNDKETDHFKMSIDIPIDEVNINYILEKVDSTDINEKRLTSDDNEGRGRRRRLRKLVIPLLLALKLKFALFTPIILSVVSLIALKGLWAGMSALGVASILALKSLMNSHVKVMYEPRHPHHYHYPPPMAMADYYHHHHHGHPDYYWARREDSYKPMAGWSGVYEPTDTQWPYTTTYVDNDRRSIAEVDVNNSKQTDCNKQSPSLS